jgi:heterodisulfide reductase subunit A-like polyferredoxin
MTLILALIVLALGYKLYQTSKQKQIAYTRYMDDRVVHNQQPHFMVTPDGRQVPMWCPNCGRNL